MIKNIIFDLDGTLLDSMPVWDNVAYDLLIRNNIVPPADLDEIIKSMSFMESAKYFVNSLGLKITENQVVEEVINMVKHEYCYDIQLKPFAYELLQKANDKNLKMCILTSSEMDFVVPALKRLNIHQFFCNILSCTELGLSKNSEEIYIKTAEKLNMKVEETAVFEDAVFAVKSAVKAGFKTIAVYDASAATDAEEIKMYCHKYIKSFKEIL